MSNTNKFKHVAKCYYINNNVFFFVCVPQVETVGERIVLYILNRVIYRAKEMSSDELPFLCHGEKDHAKILWNKGEAVGFYSVKPSGNYLICLCKSTSALWSVVGFQLIPTHCLEKSPNT